MSIVSQTIEMVVVRGRERLEVRVPCVASGDKYLRQTRVLKGYLFSRTLYGSQGIGPLWKFQWLQVRKMIMMDM